mmetsp:Transcript_48939/g.153103  ORF Transcript_48939/g.153103 Transcript_48939/m.153103 type:complete len:273 (-) Transcript_48939:694-1512(-)
MPHHASLRIASPLATASPHHALPATRRGAVRHGAARGGEAKRVAGRQAGAPDLQRACHAERVVREKRHLCNGALHAAPRIHRRASDIPRFSASNSAVQVLQTVIEELVGLCPLVLSLDHHQLRFSTSLQVHPLVVLAHAVVLQNLRAQALEIHVPTLRVDPMLLVQLLLRVYGSLRDDPRAEAHVLDVSPAALEHDQHGRHGVGVSHKDHVVLLLSRLPDVRLRPHDESLLGRLQRLRPHWLLAKDLDTSVLRQRVEDVEAKRPHQFHQLRW